MERLGNFIAAPIMVAWSLAGPITYILAVVDTWHTRMSVVWKLIFSLTLDAIAAAVWPITWIIWIGKYMYGYDTPLRLLFG